MNKTLMAQNIVMALYGLNHLPPVTNASVVRMVQRNSKKSLEYKFGLAYKVLVSANRTILGI